MENKNWLSLENSSEIVLELKAGCGGEDSKNFVDELFAAYCRYIDSKGFRNEILYVTRGHVMAKVSGSGVWHAFKHETGQHACQRVPITERNGRKQTSMVSVGVLPVKDDVYAPLDLSECEISAQMCKLHSGGQNAQKNATAIRAIHKPTGISVFIQNERSQVQNRAIALRILSARVNDMKQAKVDNEYAEFRRTRLGDGHRGSKIRTYNFMQSRVADHQLGTKTSNIDGIMRGKFDLILK